MDKGASWSVDFIVVEVEGCPLLGYEVQLFVLGVVILSVIVTADNRVSGLRAGVDVYAEASNPSPLEHWASPTLALSGPVLR